jgi:hypothetical protein
MTGPVASPVFRLRCSWRDARDGTSGAGPDSVRRRNLRIAIDALATTVLIALLVSSAWLMIVPTGDQPILALVESATGIGQTRFLGAGERDAYESAARDAYASNTKWIGSTSWRRRRATRERRCPTTRHGASPRTRRSSTR